MKIAVYATVSGKSGYSAVGRGYCHYLRTLGEDVSLFPIQAPDTDVWWNDGKTLKEIIKPDKDMKNKYDAKLLIANPFFLDNLEDPTEYIIHYAWETDTLPVQWIHRSLSTRAVLVPSQFNKDVLAKEGIESSIVPEGYDEHYFYPESLPHSRFRFLCVSEWMPRKNLQTLIKVFADTFAGKNDVELLVKTWSSHGLPQGDIEHVINYFNRGRARVVPLFQPMPDSQLRDLYAQCDVHVSATKGEGFGRPMLEAMAVGKPNIITGWSAHTEFVNDKNGWLVDYGMEKVLPHFVEYSDDMQWAAIHEDDLSEKMMYAYEHPRETAEKGAIAAVDAKKYTWPKVTKTMINTLEEIIKKT